MSTCPMLDNYGDVKMLAMQLADILSKHPDLPVYVSTDPESDVTDNGWHEIDSVMKSDGGMVVLFVTHVPAR